MRCPTPSKISFRSQLRKGPGIVLEQLRIASYRSQTTGIPSQFGPASTDLGYPNRIHLTETKEYPVNIEKTVLIKIIWDSFPKIWQGFNTARVLGIIFLIDLTIPQLYQTPQTLSIHKCWMESGRYSTWISYFTKKGIAPQKPT